MKKQTTKNINRIEVFARFVHIVLPTDKYPGLHVQAISEAGRLLTIKCSKAIHRRVLGERSAKDVNNYHLGLRQLVHVKFRGHFDQENVLQLVDIIPNRMFTSGAAPRAAGKATSGGFNIHWDEELQGFDVWTENSETGNRDRIAYAGMSEKSLCLLLDEIRACSWGTRKQVTMLDHRVEKLDDLTFRVRPASKVTYTT